MPLATKSSLLVLLSIRPVSLVSCAEGSESETGIMNLGLEHEKNVSEETSVKEKQLETEFGDSIEVS